jgi:cell wall assembly regulator SMI1
MSDMTFVFGQVDDLTARLRRLERSCVDMLKPGIAPFDVEDAVAPAGTAPDDLVSMYGRHDGVDLPVGRTLGDGHLIPGYYWMPLAEAVEHYRGFDSLAEIWPPCWFPILADGGGGYLAVVCDPGHPDYGAVVEYLPGEPEQDLVYDSVSMMLATAIRCFEAGAWRVKGAFLDEDFEASEALADTLNSGRREVEAGEFS